MDVVTKDVKRLVRKELANANRNFRMFASPHEGWRTSGRKCRRRKRK